TLTLAHTCNGTGTCVTPSPATIQCAPFLCSNGSCTTNCTGDAACAANGYCSGGMCLAKKPNGQSCTAAGQCTSGNCVDGFCCDTACNGLCQACAASLQQAGGGGSGTCSPAANGQPDPRGVCTTSAMSTCAHDGTCQGGACHLWASGIQC